MDEPSTLIAGNEPDLILISKILPKCCVNSVSTARLTLHGYQSFYNLTPTLTRPHVQHWDLHLQQIISF